MSFTDAVSSGVSQLFSAKGRSSRSEFWWFYLFVILVEVVAATLDSVIGLSGLFSSLVQVIASVFMIIASIRRLHDTDHSGWFQLVPIYGFVLLFMRGDEGENRF